MKEYLDYLRNEKKKAANTVIAYERDIVSLQKFLQNRNGRNLEDCNETDAVAFVMQQSSQNKSKPTITRMISSLRGYYDFEIKNGRRSTNPFTKIKSAKADKREIDYLTVDEVFRLMELPSSDRKGIRDKALMEFMYGTGARVTEVTRLKLSDINLRMNFATLRNSDSESRIVPIGRYAHKALSEYLENVYPIYSVNSEEEDLFFLNQRGNGLTRQGIWKILKEYGKELDLAERMTPHILRDSFAVHILQNGGDLKSLQELMGFDNIAAGIAYLSATNIRVKDVYTKAHPRA